MLRWLHGNNRLIKIGTSAVEMTPTTGFSIVLSELNQIIAEQRGLSVDDLALKSSLDPKDNANAKVAENQLVKTTETAKKPEAKPTAEVVNAEPAVDATPEDQAKFFRSQADKLAKQAAEMRRKAEELSPTKKKTIVK